MAICHLNDLGDLEIYMWFNSVYKNDFKISRYIQNNSEFNLSNCTIINLNLLCE